MSVGETERRNLALLICVLSVPSLVHWVVRVLPDSVLIALLDGEHGSPLAKSLLNISANAFFFSPVIFGVSLWAFRRIRPTLPAWARVGLGVLVAAPGSVVLYMLAQLLFLLSFKTN